MLRSTRELLHDYDDDEVDDDDDCNNTVFTYFSYATRRKNNSYCIDTKYLFVHASCVTSIQISL